IGPQIVPCRSRCPNCNIPFTTTFSLSAEAVMFACPEPGRSSCRTPWFTSPSASEKSSTADGWSPLPPSTSACTTHGRAPSIPYPRDLRRKPHKCHPCTRTKTSPMYLLAHRGSRASHELELEHEAAHDHAHASRIGPRRADAACPRGTCRSG